jgi:hypothetical protein
VTATSGAVTATATYAGTAPQVRNARLTIARSGQIVYDQPITAPICGSDCQPMTLRIRRLQAGPEPQVILAVWTGGANCCEVDEVFTWAPAAGTYARATHDFLDAGSALRDLDHNGRDEFVSANGTFKYVFTDGAASGEPLQILRFSAGRFIDVTRHYRSLIRADAARWLRFFKHNLSDGVGLIAAWAADEDELGHARMVDAYLHRQARAGHLRAADGQAGGERFIRHLHRFLRRHGYLR